MISQPNQLTKHSGIYIGLVKDNMDPDKLGRLKISIPTYNDNTALDDLQWCNYIMPYGGYKDEGFFFIPAVGAEVVVMFPNGAEKPLWFGCINKKVDNPGPREATREADDEHYWQRKQIKTRTGWILWDDKDEYISIKHNCGSFITLDILGDINIRAERHVNIKAGKSINITAEKGDYCAEAFHSFKMEAHNGDFTQEADKGKMAMSALKDNVFICSGKKIHAIADTDIKLYANKGIFLTSAKESVNFSSAKDILSYAKKQIKSQSDKETFISSKESMVLNSDRNFTQKVNGNLKSTIGKTGIIQFGKSTDLIIKTGDLNITAKAGEFKCHAAKDMILDTKKEFSLFAKSDITQYTNKNLKFLSKNNTYMTSYRNFNTQVFRNVNTTARKDMCLSGKTGVYISSTLRVDTHAGIEIKDHTPLMITEESKVLHQVRSNYKKENMKLWTTSSVTTIHSARAIYVIRAGKIFLN